MSGNLGSLAAGSAALLANAVRTAKRNANRETINEFCDSAFSFEGTARGSALYGNDRARGTMTATAMRLLRQVEPAADDDLLGRYVATRDEAAFAAIARRYGPMVLGVCRRRLGPGPDADDAFQVTFMVLARDAARIANRAALPGWLHRVASLSALKFASRARKFEALSEAESAPGLDPAAAAEMRELGRVLEEELAALPEKLRRVVLLCGLDEKTNTEAALLLNCPTGTVDSRLSAARQRLAARLTRRGVIVPAAANVALRPANVSGALSESAVRAATAYAAGSTSKHPLSAIADGVTTTMGSAKLKLLVLAGLAATAFGSAGFGLLAAPGDGTPTQKPPAKEAKAEPAKQLAEPLKVAAEPVKKYLADETAVRAALDKPAPKLDDDMALRDLCEYLHHGYGINARLDLLAFKRLGGDGEVATEPQDILQYYEIKLRLTLTRGLNIADLLNEAAAQLPGKVGIRIRGNQVLFGPSYVPPYTPGARSNDQNDASLFVSQKTLMEQIVGEPVSISIEEKPLTEVLRELRTLTGANIVVDNRFKDKAKAPVSGTFSDVRLLTAMTIFADMCELKPVWNNNVYYITSPENAARIQKDVNKELFGEPALAVPAGYVTDGLQLFVKPGDLKPAEQGLGTLGFKAVPAPAPAKP